MKLKNRTKKWFCKVKNIARRIQRSKRAMFIVNVLVIFLLTSGTANAIGKMTLEKKPPTSPTPEPQYSKYATPIVLGLLALEAFGWICMARQASGRWLWSK